MIMMSDPQHCSCGVTGSRVKKISGSSAPPLLLRILVIPLALMIIRRVASAPVRAPDLTRCQAAVDNSVVGPPVKLFFNCCLPLPPNAAMDGRSGVVDFSFGKYTPLRKRIRRPAHTAGAAYVAKYNKAYERMRALPAHDPRSMAAQANTHCAFCNGAYMQPGTNLTLQVHFSWLFLVWHRWFLFFHERILGSLVADPGFALVFWNWDDQLAPGQSGAGGNFMPAMFALDPKSNSSLYDAKRNPAHAPPALVRLNPLSNTTNNSVIVEENLNSMYQSVVTASRPSLFFGGAYRFDTDLSDSSVLNAPLGGQIENGIHNAIHFWTGDPNQELLQDMGTFTTAARDPIFYAHHSNVDRLWEVWRSIPGGTRHPPRDPDFLDAEFVFYDENADLVRVKVRDALDTQKLGVTYKHVRRSDRLWLHFDPQPSTTGNLASVAKAMGVPEVGPASQDMVEGGSIDLGKRFTALLRLPSKPAAPGGNQSRQQDEVDLDEVLVIQGVEFMRERFLQLVVFVNLPDADRDTPVSGAEYVGSFNVVPRGHAKRLFTNVRLEIGDNLRRIGIQNDPLVVITIVVKTQAVHSSVDVKIRGMEIVYQ